jgi:hypothetical protein
MLPALSSPRTPFLGRGHLSNYPTYRPLGPNPLSAATFWSIMSARVTYASWHGSELHARSDSSFSAGPGVRRQRNHPLRSLISRAPNPLPQFRPEPVRHCQTARKPGCAARWKSAPWKQLLRRFQVPPRGRTPTPFYRPKSANGSGPSPELWKKREGNSLNSSEIGDCWLGPPTPMTIKAA